MIDTQINLNRKEKVQRNRKGKQISKEKRLRKGKGRSLINSLQKLPPLDKVTFPKHILLKVKEYNETLYHYCNEECEMKVGYSYTLVSEDYIKNYPRLIGKKKNYLTWEYSFYDRNANEFIGALSSNQYFLEEGEYDLSEVNPIFLEKLARFLNRDSWEELKEDLLEILIEKARKRQKYSDKIIKDKKYAKKLDRYNRIQRQSHWYDEVYVTRQNRTIFKNALNRASKYELDSYEFFEELDKDFHKKDEVDWIY